MVRKLAGAFCFAAAVFFAAREVNAQAQFLRGDSNNDKKIDISDPVGTLNGLFTGGPTPPCRDAADSNDSGSLDISDGIYTLNFLFLGGDPPAPPYPNFEADPTD